jgi:hypothetical protein
LEQLHLNFPRITFGPASAGLFLWPTRGCNDGIRKELVAAVKESPGCAGAFKEVSRDLGIKVP